MNEFYFVMDCGNCEEEIYYGINITTLKYQGLPAIPFDFASQTNFRCDHCGASNYTSDLEVFIEGGNNYEEG